MTKLKKQMWAKCAALILAVITGLSTIVFTLLALFVGTIPELQGNERVYREAVYRQMLTSYAAYLRDAIEETDAGHIEGLDVLDGGNIRYVVQRQSGSCYDEFVDENYVTLYANDRSLNEDNALLKQIYEEGDGTVHFNLSSFQWAMRGAYYWDYSRNENNWVNTSLDEIRYNENDGFFYMVSSDEYYLVPNFYVDEYEDSERTNWIQRQQYQLQSDGDTLGYYTAGTEGALTKEKVKAWIDDGRVSLLFDSLHASFDAAGADENEEWMQVRVGSWNLPETQIHQMLSYGGVIGDMSYYVAPRAIRTVYRVFLAVREEPREELTLKGGATDYLWEATAFADSFYSFSRYWGWYLGGSVILFILCMVFLLSAAGHRREDEKIHLRWSDRIPFGIYTGAMILIGTMVFFFAISLIEYGFRYNEISMGLIVAGSVVPTVLFAALVLLYSMSIAVRIKAKQFLRYTLCYYLWRPFVWCHRAIRENTAMYTRFGLIFFAVTVIEFMFVASLDYNGSIVKLFLLFKLVETPFFIYIFWQMNRLREGGRRIAAGDYSNPIDTKHMLWDFKRHAENLNNVSSGISVAVDERMKSERFRTELITNVSHDIKTPLTSIINYVDLIRKEEITSPTMQEYVDVLQRQSLRLKKLIEDLMEASKASTGNLSVNMEPCDAVVMLSQVVGEFSGRAEANNLELIVDSPKPPVQILADGRHLWRVLDNLMSNVCKYAMPGTRVYIDLEVFHGMVIMTFRNISKSRLNISSEELMERFVRGDSSRNTEGSGLGLNIAQSLTALMNGNMAIQVDGDLFKAIVSFQELKTKETTENAMKQRDTKEDIS